MIWRLARRNVWRKAGRLTSVTGFSKAREDACCIVQGSRARAAPRKGVKPKGTRAAKVTK
jgi:hypothetical protein